MPLPDPVPGMVISYAYLWRDQQDLGRDEGVKDRPCVVVLAVRQEDTQAHCHRRTDHSLAAPRCPGRHRTARRLKTPPEARRSTIRIVATELNHFLCPGPDLRPVPGKPGAFAYGSLPMRNMLQLRERIAELHRDRRFRMVHRSRYGDEHER